MIVRATQLISLILLVVHLLAPSSSYADSTEYESIEWIQLMPKEDLDALLNPPELVMNVEDGSAEDNIDSLGELSEGDAAAQRFYEALKSKRVVEAFDKKSIRLPGFVVPLASDEKNRVTEFFIVPYFGACLHLPPPPPNQIVYATIKEGFELESLYDAFWFEGQLNIEDKDHELGTSAYSLALDSLYPYKE